MLSDFAYEILRTLRTSTIASVVEKLVPFLHMDPVQTLPPEITFQIFSYLDTQTLLTASLASRAWRERIMDSQLWKHAYATEGWRIDREEIYQAQKERTIALQAESREAILRQANEEASQPKLKKRVPPNGLASAQAPGDTESSGLFGDARRSWNQQHDAIEADTPAGAESTCSSRAEVDQEMLDAPASDGKVSEGSIIRKSSKRGPSDDSSMGAISSQSTSPDSTHNLFTINPSFLNPPLFTQTSAGEAYLNFAHLYKQRRRLEENWSRGRCTHAQFPLPNHKEEGHRECVYTIQFVGKWLVSGSRDRTIRIWDMETRRLRGPPLVGHSQSVLCLQFDPSEKEDVIISGSSDTNVIVWCFSTGKMVCKIPNAHSESVLNLRFDERYLVTCSKDRLIKVWTRKKLSPLDPDYIARQPDANRNEFRFPSYIIDPTSIPSPVLEAQIAKGTVKTLSPYNLIMILEGHVAAVNAVQIDGDEIVSASGDRSIRVWNIRENRHLRRLEGHVKGIACVQFDSKRVVSGSSDNTVRIFDHQTGAEVACLVGHKNLVRTVQANFGDLPGAEEDLEAAARQHDLEFFKARENGEVPREWFSQRSTRARNVQGALGGRAHGSNDLKDKRFFGARLPPGGGGSRWARIVSGGYDETIIIWKRARDGSWEPGQKLSQKEAIQPSVRRPRPLPPPLGGANPANTPAGHQLQLQLLSNAANMAQQGQQATAAAAPIPANVIPPVPVIPGGHLGNPLVPPGAAPAQMQAAAQAMLAGHNGMAQDAFEGGNSTARVFKLQFDARRIICCSQDPRITVWDFANGDPEIEEASQFFVGY